MHGRAAIHMAGRPLLMVSTDFWTLDTLIDHLRIVAAKSWTELTQSVTDRPLGPFDLWFGPRGLHVTNIPVVTLSLVEFQMFF
jgi:hypothetical protein